MKVKELIPFIKNPSSTMIYFEDEGYGTFLDKLSPNRYENVEILDIESFDNETYINVTRPFDEKKWVNEMYAQYTKDSSFIQSEAYRGTTLVFDYRHPEKKMGWAKLKEGDVWWREKGIAIAYAKFKGYKIPKEL